jgi:cell division protein FtsW
MMNWRNSVFPVRENFKGDLEWRIDALLLAITVTLLCTGWVMVSSASIDYAWQGTGSAFYFSIRHGVYVLASLLFMAAVMLVPFNTWRRFDSQFLLLAALLLLIVLVPGIGKKVNGSQRWLNLGFMTLQASELAKWASMIYFSGYFVRRMDEIHQSLIGFFKPFAVLFVLAVLLLAEPDFGATVVICLSVLTLMFLAGAPLFRFFLLLFLVLGLAALLAVTESYRFARLLAFVNPWDEKFVYGSGYQLTQSLIAISRGEWFGVGLGNSVQKLFYLPEAHTDFVFSIWAEETGLMGSLTIVALFAAMVWRIFRIAKVATQRGDKFASLVVTGIALLVAYQAFINMGVAAGLLPTKGLTLPFISYGGSSLIISAGMIGMVLRLSFENVTEARIDKMMSNNARSGDD